MVLSLIHIFQAGNSDDGTIEVIERLFVDDGGDFAGEASSARVLVQDNHFVRLPHSLRDGFAVERRDLSLIHIWP